MGNRSKRFICREHVDYTDLLAELQNKESEAPPVEVLPPKEKEAKPPEFSLTRQRLMSDEQVLFLYEKDSDMIHDKTCLKVRAILDENLQSAQKYPSHMRPCPLCQTKAYLSFEEQNLDMITEHIEALAEKLDIPPRKLLSHVLDYRLNLSKKMPFAVTTQEPYTFVSNEVLLAEADKTLADFASDYKRMAE